MYTEHFGFSGKPFRLSPDVSFFFPSSEHKRALAFLQYGVAQADGFVIITGDVGTGKTTLLQALLKQLDQEDMLVATVVTTQLAQDDLLCLVAAELNVPEQTTGKAPLLKGIEKHLRQQAEAGRRVLLIVDEAQNLPPGAVEELRMLSNFQKDGRPLLQTLLVGQSELRATLLSDGFEQLRQRVIATYHLNPLNVEETSTYIRHRLGLVGWTSDPDFLDEALEAIHAFTDGVPRRINNLCDRVLLYAFLEDIHVIDERVVEIVSDEIGLEFGAGLPEPKSAPKVPESGREGPEPDMQGGRIFDRPGQPLETMAKVMFDKANVQQRLSSLERAVDGLGLSLKPEMAALKEELAYVRGLLEDVLMELRSQNSDPSRKRRA